MIHYNLSISVFLLSGNGTLVCSGRGKCVCGECVCSESKVITNNISLFHVLSLTLTSFTTFATLSSEEGVSHSLSHAHFIQLCGARKFGVLTVNSAIKTLVVENKKKHSFHYHLYRDRSDKRLVHSTTDLVIYYINVFRTLVRLSTVNSVNVPTWTVKEILYQTRSVEVCFL